MVWIQPDKDIGEKGGQTESDKRPAENYKGENDEIRSRFHNFSHLAAQCIANKLHFFICGSWWGKKVPNVTNVCGVYL